MKKSKWKEIDGVDVLFGELAGYTICIAKNYSLDRCGLSFCNPTDRVKWDRQKGVDMALDRADTNKDSIQFNESFGIEDYVTYAVYKTDYVPQSISDSVRENSKQLSKITDKKKLKALAKMEQTRKKIR